MRTIESPAIPFCHPIHGGLPTDAEVIVHGAVFNGHNKYFSVNLRAGSDIALHFNPRFKHFSEHTIVLNTLRHGDWQLEERHKNRLNIGDTFRLRIALHHSHFLVELNDKHVCHYQHRISPAQITHLEIQGDVSIQRVHLVDCEQYVPTDGHIDLMAPAPMFPPPPPAYSSYPDSQPQMPSSNSSYPNLSSAYTPGPTAYPPGPNAYSPAPASYGLTVPAPVICCVETCDCSTEHCHHGIHWDPHHHHESHHHHHHHC